MMDQYFGVKELYEVVLRAKVPIKFGERYIEEGEPVLYFENITMSQLGEDNTQVMARGGWANLPHVIWEDRTDVTFSLQEGILSNLSMGILFSANVLKKEQSEKLYVNKREGPIQVSYYPQTENDILNDKPLQSYIKITEKPIMYPKRKTFIYDWENNMPQKKLYGKLLPERDSLDNYIIDLYEDKGLQIPAQHTKQCLVDYYYEYENEALFYRIQKERFNNGLFTLEGKFYSKDENEGKNYTNIMYMPKVRVVSDINLRLGERASPSLSVFNIIGMPENMGGNRKGLILEITRLNSDIDSDI